MLTKWDSGGIKMSVFFFNSQKKKKKLLFSQYATCLHVFFFNFLIFLLCVMQNFYALYKDVATTC